MAETTQNRRLIPRIPRVSLITQVAIFFLAGLMITGWISYAILKRQYRETVREQQEKQAIYVLTDVIMDITRLDAFDWLIPYWWKHCHELDVDYIPNFVNENNPTKKKAQELGADYADVRLERVNVDTLEKIFNEADQKKFAEIFYNRISVSFDNVVLNYKMKDLTMIVVDPEYREATVLFCADDYLEDLGQDPSTWTRARYLGDAYTVTEEMGEVMAASVERAERMSYDEDAESNDYLHMEMSDGCVYYYVPIFELEGGYTAFIYESFDQESYLAEIRTDTWRGVRFLLLFQVILTAICLVLLIIFVLRPIRKTRIAVRQYTSDKECETVLAQLKKIRTRNEIGELRDDLSDMFSEMDHYMKEIREKTAEKERISTELSVATKIQADMLPKKFPAFPDRKEFDVYATMTPAKEVGGDFYDFFLIDEDHLALVIADVSGKGVPAALFMVISRTLLRNRAMMGGTPSEILADVNHLLSEGNATGYFVTVWIAILEISTGKGLAANAGHEHPALRKKDGRFEMVKYRHSPAVATMDGIPFREHEFRLEPGDRIYVYTDGVTEAINEKEELFGEDRLLEALNRKPECTPEELLRGVKEEIDSFAGEAVQFDDITMLALDYTGPERP